MIPPKQSRPGFTVVADGEALRLFATAALVYLVFINPWLQASMTWSLVDSAVSLVESGSWTVTHTYLYGAVDVVTIGDRVVTDQPPGLALMLTPVYLLWRVLLGPLESTGNFQAFNTVSVVLLSIPVSALLVLQVAWLAGFLGAGRRGVLLSALLFAFGTQNFFLGTTLFKENFAALAVIAALRLALEPRGPIRLLAAGAVAGAAMTLSIPCGLMGPLLVYLVGRRRGVREIAVFLSGYLPVMGVVAVFNSWIFGRPWYSGYDFVGSDLKVGFLWPKLLVLVHLLIGPNDGLLLYAPFLLLGFRGLALAWKGCHREEVLVSGIFVFGLWFVSAAWISKLVNHSFWAEFSLGPRMMFPAVPLLAAFAGVAFQQVSRGSLKTIMIPSLVFGYLAAQAGFIPAQESSTNLAYALKTWASGMGMGVFFKEGIPQLLEMETLHTFVSGSDISFQDLIDALPTSEGLMLVRNQILVFAANVAALGVIAWVIKRLWWERTA